MLSERSSDLKKKFTSTALSVILDDIQLGFAPRN